ncbi:hypothetical protein SFA32_02375 [Buttiauxella sp. HR94]|nr:hypothetical protein SFA32_02375 [Buttiauxella sp. HR94]
MTIEIIEDSIGWLENYTVEDIPQNLPRGISLHLKEGILGLQPSGVVGSFPLNNGETVRIIPKIGHVNFLSMLFKAEGNLDSMNKEFDKFIELSSCTNENFISIVSKAFIWSLDRIIAKSPMSQRVWKKKSLENITGRVDLLKTIEKTSRNSQNPIVSSVKLRNFNTPENRLLSEAAIRVYYNKFESLTLEQKHILQIWLKKFKRSSKLNDDLLHVDKKFSINAYGGSRDYYRKALMLAKIIIGSTGVNLQGLDTIYSDAILMNSADVFEKYIRATLSKAYAEHGYIIQKGTGNNSLYIDGSYSLEPDIIIEKDNEVKLIADAKYKKPDSKDHYQMISYLTTYNLKRGILISPNFNSDEVEFKNYTTNNKKNISEIYLPMANLAVTESYLSTILESSLQKS